MPDPYDKYMGLRMFKLIFFLHLSFTYVYCRFTGRATIRKLRNRPVVQ